MDEGRGVGLALIHARAQLRAQLRTQLLLAAPLSIDLPLQVGPEGLLALSLGGDLPFELRPHRHHDDPQGGVGDPGRQGSDADFGGGGWEVRRQRNQQDRPNSEEEGKLPAAAGSGSWLGGLRGGPARGLAHRGLAHRGAARLHWHEPLYLFNTGPL